MAYWGRMMLAPAAPSSFRRIACARPCWPLLPAPLALMPLAMWLQPLRSARSGARRAGSACRLDQGMCLGGRSPLTQAGALTGAWRPAPRWVLLAAFLAFALLSTLWSHDRPASLRAFAELVIPILSGLIIALILPADVAALGAGRCCWNFRGSCLTLAELRGLLVGAPNGPARQQLCLQPHADHRAGAAVPLAAWLLTARRGGLAVALMVLGRQRADGLRERRRQAWPDGRGRGRRWLRFLPRASRLPPWRRGWLPLAAFAPVKGEVIDRLIPPTAPQAMQESHSRTVC